MPRSTIRFLLNGERVELDGVDPTRTVLQFLREDRRLTGTKEGCAEGDCGACTVVVIEVDREGDGLELRTVNACIQFLPTLDGKELITVEGLEGRDGGLHPVQQAMVDNHGSQCGFCTPGFVMSLYALYRQNPEPTRRDIDDALAGNLCRCTGYRPIIAAAASMHAAGEESPWHPEEHREQLAALDVEESLAIEWHGRSYFAPCEIDEFATLYTRHPDATLLAGGTDVGLWVTKQYRDLGTVISTGRVPDLRRVVTHEDCVEIGAAVTLSEAIPEIVRLYPGLDEMFRRFASPPIRNAGTLGGNVANGSPIGDSMPALMVLGASLLLRRGDDEREIALDRFYHDYQVNDLRPGEFVAAIRIPKPDGAIVTSHKWSKRFDQDISGLCSAYRLVLDEGIAQEFRMACGGLAATVRRAPRCEAVVTGAPWNQATIEEACAALAEDFEPITDMRASADMRRLAAQNLLRRFFLETTGGIDERVYTYGR